VTEAQRLAAVRRYDILGTPPDGADDATSQRYATRLGNRIQALAHTHDLIAEEERRGARLDELARGQVTQLVGMESPRVELSGPSLMVTPAAAQNIGLALHELASNAA